MTRDDESTLLTTGHIEPELLLRREGKEFSSQTSHLRNKVRIDAVIDDLEYPPVLTGLNDFTANLSPAATSDVVDSGEGDDRNFIAEMVVRDFGTLVFVADERGLQSRLVGEGGEGGRSH